MLTPEQLTSWLAQANLALKDHADVDSLRTPLYVRFAWMVTKLTWELDVTKNALEFANATIDSLKAGHPPVAQQLLDLRESQLSREQDDNERLREQRRQLLAAIRAISMEIHLGKTSNVATSALMAAIALHDEIQGDANE